MYITNILLDRLTYHWIPISIDKRNVCSPTHLTHQRRLSGSRQWITHVNTWLSSRLTAHRLHEPRHHSFLHFISFSLYLIFLFFFHLLPKTNSLTLSSFLFLVLSHLFLFTSQPPLNGLWLSRDDPRLRLKTFNQYC